MNRRLIVPTFALLLFGLLCPARATVPAGWTTSGVKILDPNGGQYIISGINWYGAEYSTSPTGLDRQDFSTILNGIKAKGFNTLRLSFASQVWETNPLPTGLTACPSCQGKHSRDILALIINYAGSIGLHVILDNHRSEIGSSAEANGLWYASGYTEQSWIGDWVHIEDWVHGMSQSQGSADTVEVNLLASDGFPIVLGFDLRNEPHTASTYATGARWGSGDARLGLSAHLCGRRTGLSHFHRHASRRSRLP